MPHYSSFSSQKCITLFLMSLTFLVSACSSKDSTELAGMNRESLDVISETNTTMAYLILAAGSERLRAVPHAEHTRQIRRNNLRAVNQIVRMQESAIIHLPTLDSIYRFAMTSMARFPDRNISITDSVLTSHHGLKELPAYDHELATMIAMDHIIKTEYHILDLLLSQIDSDGYNCFPIPIVEPREVQRRKDTIELVFESLSPAYNLFNPSLPMLFSQDSLCKNGRLVEITPKPQQVLISKESLEYYGLSSGEYVFCGSVIFSSENHVDTFLVRKSFEVD